MVDNSENFIYRFKLTPEVSLNYPLNVLTGYVVITGIIQNVRQPLARALQTHDCLGSLNMVLRLLCEKQISAHRRKNFADLCLRGEVAVAYLLDNPAPPYLSRNTDIRSCAVLHDSSPQQRPLKIVYACFLDSF